MNHSKARKEIAALRDAALEDLGNTADSQLHKEAHEAGENLGAVAAHVRSVMRDAAASVQRQRLAQARVRMGTKAKTVEVGRPALEIIKQMIQGAFAGDPALGLAFRDGKTQSDADWLSLYDDLVALGAIKPDNHER